MDFRLQLLLHIPLGLVLEPKDVAQLCRADLDPQDGHAVRMSLVSPAARGYLAQHHDWSEIAQRVLQASAHHGIRWSHLSAPDYPQEWRTLSRMPMVFSYQGEPSWLKHSGIAIVGSRTPALESLQWLQRELPEFLRQRRPMVVSGGARGIDQWAHRLAMDNGVPTVCILPSGLLEPYPFGYESFWQRILATGGCLLSTCGLRDPLRKSFFHIRNRWIAGLAPLTFVVEANRRSGSALTAKLARDEARDVCTLPVFPMASQGLGNLDLIAEGATLLRDSMDLIICWDRSNPAVAQNFNREK
jgi:DNA processing protein